MPDPTNGDPAPSPDDNFLIPDLRRSNESRPKREILCDAAGPIPSFGPAKTDENGRIVMSDEEWEARRLAAIRTLDVLHTITDESDARVDWEEFSRALERRS